MKPEKQTKGSADFICGHPPLSVFENRLLVEMFPPPRPGRPAVGWLQSVSRLYHLLGIESSAVRP